MAKVLDLKSDSKRWLPRRIGIANDHVRVPYANGSSFASQFLYREFNQRGHEVTVIGPEDPVAREEELPDNRVLLSSVPLNAQPGVHLALPTRRGLRELARKRIDIFLGQTGTGMIDLGLWLRRTHNIPFLSVNTFHWASYYQVLFPESIQNTRAMHYVFSDRVIPWLERQIASAYNRSDGLVVLSGGLKQYWRDRGVNCPIHVIPRSVDPTIFDQPAGDDPFPRATVRGHRLLSVCRHSREKSLERLLGIFARAIAPEDPLATLTLVGDGPDHEGLIKLARDLKIDDRVFFEGERPLRDVQSYYKHADLFVYTSLSETYGQVVSEALWCGLPVVAMNDGMGVQQQVTHESDGLLISPGPDESLSDWRFGRAVLQVLENEERRLAMAEAAERRARGRCAPEENIRRFYEAFHLAKEHLDATGAQSSSATSVVSVPPAYHLARWASLHVAASALGSLRRAEPTPIAVADSANWDKDLRTNWDSNGSANRIALSSETRPLSSNVRPVRKLV
jgi:glycosyltransferase involved in cell wall biosynthesis